MAKSRKQQPGTLLAWLFIGISLPVIVWLCWRIVVLSNPAKKTAKPQAQSIPAAHPAPTQVQVTPATNRPAPPVVAAVPVTNHQTAPEPQSQATNRFVEHRPPSTITATNDAQLIDLHQFPRPAQSMMEAQIALARLGISPGSIDGLVGPQTRAALRVFQTREKLSATGELDLATRERLLLEKEPVATRTITDSDLAGLQPVPSTWLGKSQQTALGYENVLELLAEASQSHPTLVRSLNPKLNWLRVTSGTTVQLPDVCAPEFTDKAAYVAIYLHDRCLRAFDQEGALLVHFPCSIAQRVEKRPVGELRVEVIIPGPNYTFDPAIFPESAEARQITHKLVLPPGPNNPVGVAWIGLNKSGYGIHGTPSPEQVGRTESHGCFRLANWNAATLLKLAWVGMPVQVVP